jgi:TRAP-type transport system small permease protein
VAQAPLVLPRHRHLKWRWLDPLEAFLMILCGVCITGFTVSVFCDVVTRTIGRPWLWLQLATTGFFGYGVFIGMAVAVRRHDHLYLSEITRRTRGVTRLTIETLNRIIVLGVAVAMVWYGWKNFRLDLGSFRAPSLIPLGTYTIIVPVSGVFIALFAIEQLLNGWRRGFAGPEDADLAVPVIT